MVPKINYGGWGEGAVLAHFLSGIFWRGFLSDLQNFPGFSGIVSPKVGAQSSSDFKGLNKKVSRTNRQKATPKEKHQPK